MIPDSRNYDTHLSSQVKKDYTCAKYLLGPSVSGFGWDDARKIVTASDDVWDALIQVRALFTRRDSYLTFSILEQAYLQEVEDQALPAVRPVRGAV